MKTGDLSVSNTKKQDAIYDIDDSKMPSSEEVAKYQNHTDDEQKLLKELDEKLDRLGL